MDVIPNRIQAEVVQRISFLFLDSERVWRGGQDQLFTLLQGLLRNGHSVHLACYPNTLLEQRAREAGISVHTITIRSEVGFSWFLKFLGILRRVRPDVLGFNTPKTLLLGSIASHIARVPVRILFRRVSFPLRKNLITRMKYRRGVDLIIAISESIRSQLQAGGVPRSKIRIVYEGLDLNYYQKRQSPRVSRPGSPFIVGTVAHLSTEKGMTYLVQAAALIPDVQSRIRFLIIGDGACRRELEEQVRTLNLEKCFRFTGFRKRTAVYYKCFDLFVLPSLSEGLSSAILAAMATSIPVVATNVGGIPELITSGENGYLVPPGNPARLAKAIQQFLDDPKKSFEFGQNGRTRVERQFTLDRKVAETEQLCLALLRNSVSA